MSKPTVITGPLCRPQAQSPNPWPYIKAVGAHLTDWSFQTSAQAIHKQHCWRHRARHVAIIAGSHAVAALTSESVPMSKRLAYITINAGSHYAIDSFRMCKWLDQGLHLAIALASAPLLQPQREIRP